MGSNSGRMMQKYKSLVRNMSTRGGVNEDVTLAATDGAIRRALNAVYKRIDAVLNESGWKGERADVRLVAVSKTKPVEMLMECYEAGQRVFGENYAQELIEKASVMPKDIQWHFIGPLQSNKAAPLVKKVGSSLSLVETVSTMKLANKLNRAVGDLKKESDVDDFYRLGILIQINTSNEKSKSGVSTSEAVTLANEICNSCPNLHFKGLMTIGAPGDMSCFNKLHQCRSEVAKSIGVAEAELELSMGMSGDFEEAIRRGATNVRVGSTIFGARDYSNLQK